MASPTITSRSLVPSCPPISSHSTALSPPCFLHCSSSSSSFLSHSSSLSLSSVRRPPPTSTAIGAPRSLAVSASFKALIFDCDGVILESEDLHRQAYNDAFAFFNVRCPSSHSSSSSSSESLDWDAEFYDEFQNRVGGGKPKMRWYFKEHGWPTSKIFEAAPENDADKEKLIDILQDWKTKRYQEIIKSGTVEPRPGVLSLMDETKATGKLLAVCSAATKSSVIMCLENLIGLDRFQSLDCFLAGDDVKEKKPDPSIYITAAKKLGVAVSDCLVVEDSIIGLQAATQAGMSCIITHTSSTANQDFSKAIAVYPDLSSVRLKDLELLFQNVVAA
ncbi:hypothetical protein V2J09_021711 [Rumex salicifolius]